MLALVIAGKELRQRLRDRTAYIVAIGAPFLLATVMGLALAGVEDGFSTEVAIVDDDGGALSAVLLDCVFGSDDLREIVGVRRVADARAARELAHDGDVAAAIVVPEGFSSVIAGGDAPPLEVARSPDDRIGADVAESVVRAFAAQVAANRLAVTAAIDAGVPGDRLPQPPEPGEEACDDAAGAAMTAVSVTEVPATRADLSAGGRFAPAMGILFLFFTVGLGARSLVAERREGTLSRLLAAPVTGRTILVGKASASFVLGVASMVVLATATTAVLGADWGDPLSAAVLILVTVFAVMGVVGMVVTFARTEQQANGYASIAAFTLALLGGNFIDLGQAPALLRTLSLLTPNGWALRAFGDLATEGGGLVSVLPEVGAIVAFGAATSAIAIARAGKLLEL